MWLPLVLRGNYMNGNYMPIYTSWGCGSVFRSQPPFLSDVTPDSLLPTKFGRPSVTQRCKSNGIVVALKILLIQHYQKELLSEVIDWRLQWHTWNPNCAFLIALMSCCLECPPRGWFLVRTQSSFSFWTTQHFTWIGKCFIHQCRAEPIWTAGF